MVWFLDFSLTAAVSHVIFTLLAFRQSEPAEARAYLIVASLATMSTLRDILELEPIAAVVFGGGEERLPLAGLASSSKQLRDLVSSLGLSPTNRYQQGGGHTALRRTMSRCMTAAFPPIVACKGCNGLQLACHT